MASVRREVLGSIPPEKKSWKLFVDGKETPASHVILELDNAGKKIHRVVELGLIDDKRGNVYDGVRYWEGGGGGAVTIPYVVMNHELFVGLVQQFRVHMGGECWNVPRGYVEIGETHDAAAVRELSEEVGYAKGAFGKTTQLAGEPLNPNSGIIDTAPTDDGCRIYSVCVNPEALIPDHDNEGTAYRFPTDLLVKVPTAEKIATCRFISWRRAVGMKDGFTAMAVARLIAALIPEVSF